jgi:hypothetical protein
VVIVGSVQDLVGPLMNSLREKVYKAAAQIRSQCEVVAIAQAEYGMVMLSQQRRRAELSDEERSVRNATYAFQLFSGVGGNLEDRIAAHLQEAEARLAAAEKCVTDSKDLCAYLEGNVEVEKRNLNFMEGNIRQVLGSIPTVTVKLEAELRLWCNTVTDSLYHSKYQGKHKILLSETFRNHAL